MREKLISRIFWERRLSNRAQWLWTAVILLAPLAFAGAIFLNRAIVAQIPVRIEVDRAAALAIARDIAEQHGLDTAGWQTKVTTEQNLKFYRYLVRKPAAAPLVSWASATARLQSPDAAQFVQVEVDSNGRVLAYEVPPSENAPGPGAPRLAEAARARRAATLPGTAYQLLPDSPSGEFRWKVTHPDLPEFSATYSVRILGAQVVSEKYAAADAGIPGDGRGSWAGFLRGLNFAATVLLAIFVSIRYVKRRVQKEAPRERLYLVAAIFFVFVLVEILFKDQTVLIADAGEESFPAWLGWILAVGGAALFAMPAGLAWAGCEADIRERDSSLLVSLDALLAGRIFSRNVGRSVFLGAVVLSWMLLARYSIYLGATPEFAGIDHLDDAFEEFVSWVPWISVLSASVAAAIFRCLAILMAPLVFFVRRVRKQPRLPFYLLAYAWFGASVAWSGPLAGLPAAILSFVTAAFLIAAILYTDILATLVLLAGFAFVRLSCLAPIAPVWEDQDEWALLVAAAAIAISAVTAFRGPVVREEDVRPAYAREIHERLQLQNEILAAREAQVRLLPAAPPKLDGISIAASCRPAEAVSGDFYDFFPISPTKVGILVSDGGGNGLATALSIALAKGYLMHKAQAGLSPLETLRGLHETLGRELHGMNAEGLGYAVLDTADRSLRMARLGPTPALLFAGEAASSAEILHDIAGLKWCESYARLSPKQRAVIYTNGLSRLIGEPGAAATNRWLQRRLAKCWTLPAASLHDSILKTIFARRAGFGTRTATDDITVIVVGMHTEAMEHVA